MENSDEFFNFKGNNSKFYFDMSKLKGQEKPDNMTNKRRDELNIINQVKYDQMCPFWAIGYPCPNLTLKDYCTFTHNRYAKRNETLWIRLTERGHGLSDKIMTKMLTNPHDREAIARNKKLWRSYPKELQEEQK